ncbi:DNA mismatch repair protein MutS, partial [Parapusillimonas sp. SGNA-6]|nr:DNA mismatch repair protein MutS [Parapusillimonas sp. SGNA-6]
MMQDFYQNNIQKAKQELALLEKQINRNSLFRLIVIVGGGAVLFKVFQTNNIGLLLLVVFTIVFVFAALVRRQSRLEKKSDETKAFLRVNENEIQVATGQPNIYLDGVEYADGKHPYASDLDVFGPHSLFEKINRAATPEGVGRLANWLTSASGKDAILRRQEASRELAGKHAWTQMLQTKLLFNLGQKVNIKTFLQRYLQDEAFRFGNAFM